MHVSTKMSVASLRTESLGKDNFGTCKYKRNKELRNFKRRVEKAKQYSTLLKSLILLKMKPGDDMRHHVEGWST